MNREERIELVVEALDEAVRSGRSIALFVDAGQQENWVRAWDVGRAQTIRIEVTNRATPGSPLPSLTARQVDQLVKLGVGPEARPNFVGIMPEANPREVAERIEQIFEVLRSAPDFTLAVGLGHGEWKEPEEGLLDVYAGLNRAPDWEEESWGDEALLERIKAAQARYRPTGDEVLTVQPPYVVACLEFNGQFRYFADEDAIMLRTISLAMQSGDLTADQACEAYQPYREFFPEIYQPDYKDWNDWGFYLANDDQDELMVSAITREADAAGIPGVGVPWNDLSPMSGEPLIVDGEEAFAALQQHFRGRYVIVSTGNEAWWELAPDEAQVRIEEARERGGLLGGSRASR